MKIRCLLFLLLLPFLARAAEVDLSAPSEVQVGESYQISVSMITEGGGVGGFRIYLYEDGVLVAQSSSSTARFLIYNTSKSSPGPVTYTVDATSSMYGSASASCTVLVLSSNHPPQGAYNGLSGTSVLPGEHLDISGWALDYEQGAPVSRVAIYVGNNYVGDATLGGARPDVQDANVNWGFWSPLDVTYSGWTYNISTSSLSVGSYSVKAVIYDNEGFPTDMGSLSFEVRQDAHPVLYCDGLSSTAMPSDGSITVSGWALDYEMGAPVSRVEIVVDDAWLGNASLGDSRPDVQTANANSAYWSPHDVTYSGWHYTINAPSVAIGRHRMVAVAYDSAGNGTWSEEYIFVKASGVHDVLVENGSASPSSGVTDAVVQLTANSVYGYLFDYWELVSGSGYIASPNSSVSNFSIGDSDASLRAVFKATAAPSTTLSASQTSVPVNSSVTLASTTTDSGGFLVNQAIDYIAPGGSGWVSGTVAAGSRWEGGPTGRNTLNFALRLDRAGTWRFRARGSNYSGALSGYVYIDVEGTQGPPVISSSGTASGVLGESFSYQITATGSPTSFSASGLPGGLSINTASGLISGTPLSAGSFSAIIGATNDFGTGSVSLMIGISSGISVPVISSSGTVSGILGESFSYQITATGSPTSFSASGLPSGLSINTASGLISGTPLLVGDFSATIGATNNFGTGSASLIIGISSGPLAPVILIQPQGATILTNSRYAFSVTAIGNPLPTCQWTKDGNPISGATSMSYIIESAKFADTGMYKVIVSNSIGSVISTGAALVVSDNFPAADSDHDGFTDLEEIMLGTDPNAVTGADSNTSGLEIHTPNKSTNGGN